MKSAGQTTEQNAEEVSGSRTRRKLGRRCGAHAVPAAVSLLLAFGGAMSAIAQDPGEANGSATALSAGDGQSPAQAAGQYPPAAPVSDPPARVMRISVLNGAVSAEPGSVNTFSPAELNQVLTTGDRVYTDPAAAAELQAGQMAVRLGGGSDLTVTAMTDTLAQFGLAAGAVHLRSFAIDPGTVLELDSPDAAVTVLQPGDVRVDVDPAAHTTTVSLVSGQVQVDAPGYSQVLSQGQRVRLHGSAPENAAGAATVPSTPVAAPAASDSAQAAYAEPLAPAAADGLDGFSDGRDNLYASGADAASPYLNPDTVGGADLASYGSWDSSDFGPVWFPVVAAGWQPYCFGHWRWVAPWGWTWVGLEPWGFAPFHYGRWAQIGTRWGWIPGSLAVRPVYAPALVAFAGGAQFSASLGYAPGLGITAWFPLGPHEPYAPWYHGSTLYTNRVNASNIYSSNTAEVRGFYNQRAVPVFTGGASLANRAYADRLAGTVAVPQSSFAAGRAVNTAVLHLPAETLAEAPVLPHPMVAPERSMLVPRAAMALPPVLARPVMAGRGNGDPDMADAGGATLFHRAEPPRLPPSFDQQRQAMQGADPGRPLSPAQMENLRVNRPAGIGTREFVPHPPGRTGAPSAPPPSAPAPGAGPPPAPGARH